MADLVILGNENSVFNQFIMEIRNVEVQKDSMRFRRNIERIGEVFAYEISKKLNYKPQTINTPLGQCEIDLMEQQPVIATVLRAGLPLHQGVLNYFDQAENAFVSAFRKHITADEFEVHVDYMSSPSLKGKTLILCDPMLASGQSMVLSWNALVEEYGMPDHTHIVSVISSTEGTEYVQNQIKGRCTLWTGAMDQEMTAQSYIVPGLGDAGDLAYGIKE